MTQLGRGSLSGLLTVLRMILIAAFAAATVSPATITTTTVWTATASPCQPVGSVTAAPPVSP